MLVHLVTAKIGITWNEVLVAGLFVLVGTGVILFNSLKLNVMASGDDELVRSLGISPKHIRTVIGLFAVLMP